MSIKENIKPKEERLTLHNFLHSMYENTGHYLHRMAMPVNNFLKDLSQIEKELTSEINKGTQFMNLDGQLIPVEQVLKLDMEENY